MEYEFFTKDFGGGLTAAYKVNENYESGVNYYYNGQPITRERFEELGGDPGTTEAIAAQEAEYQRAALVGQNPFADRSELDQGTQGFIAGGSTVGTPSTSLPGLEGETSSGTTTPTFQPTPYDDGTGTKLYYTAEDLAQAVDRRINKDYNDSVKQIETNFRNGFLSIDERDDQIKKTRTSLIEKKKNDLQSVSGYFNAISPDAVQSGRNKLENKAVEEYTKQNTALGSELGANLYGSDGRIRQDLSSADLNPYMSELSDTGNLARAIASNYQNRASNLDSARSKFNAGLTQNAGDYINNLPDTTPVSNYSNYVNSTILGGYKPLNTGVSISSVQKTDKYGNPIDDYIYKGM